MLGGTELWVRLYRLLVVVLISWLIFAKSKRNTSYSEEDFTLPLPKSGPH